TKALLRRPGAALGTTLRASNIVFDTIGRDVSVAGIPLQLPRREAAILEHLLRRQGRVVPKSVLEEKLYGIDEELESNAVPVHVPTCGASCKTPALARKFIPCAE